MDITSNNKRILYKPVRNEISEVFFYDEVLTVEIVGGIWAGPLPEWKTILNY